MAQTESTTTQITLSPDAIPAAIAQYSIKEAVLESIKQYKSFKISDKPSYDKAVKLANNAKKLRSGIESKRKELVAPALEFQRAINDEAKRLTAIIQPTEKHLNSEIKRIDDEEAARKLLLHKKRSDELREAGFMFDGRFWMAGLFSLEASKISELNEEDYGNILDDGKKYVEGERKRKEAEEQRQREEAERIRADREKLDREKAEMAEKLAELEKLKSQQEQQPKSIDNAFDNHPPLNDDLQRIGNGERVPDPFFTPSSNEEHPQRMNPFTGARFNPTNGININNEIIRNAADDALSSDGKEFSAKLNGLPYVGESSSVQEFKRGQESMRRAVLALLSGTEKFTRSQLIDKIQSL